MRLEKEGQNIFRNVKLCKMYNNCFYQIDSNICFKFKNKFIVCLDFLNKDYFNKNYRNRKRFMVGIFK